MKRFIELFVLVTVFGCNDFFDKDVYVDLPEHQPRIVVNAVINADDTLVRIVVTKSVPMESKEYSGKRVNNAEITLLRNGVEVSSIDIGSNNEGYYFNHQPEVGDKYEITVAVPGLKTVASEVIVPTRSNLLSAKTVGKRYDIDGYEYAGIKFRIKDIPNEKNFYEVVLVNGYNRNITEYREDGTDTSFVLSSGGEVTYLLSPMSWLVETPSGLCFSDTPFQDGEVDVEVWTDSYFLDDQEGSPYIYEQYDDDGRLLYKESRDRLIYLKVRSMTEAYYDYQRTIEIHQWNQYPDLFSGEPVPMKTNIKDGFGLFGATSFSQVKVEKK